MPIQKIILFIAILILSSCVSNSTHQDVIDQNTALNESLGTLEKITTNLTKENNDLKQKIEDLVYGLPNLVAKYKTLYKNQNYSEAKAVIDTLISKHPIAIEAIEANKLLPILEEEILWATIQKNTDTDLYKKYEELYPNGKYKYDIQKIKRDIANKKDAEAYQEAKSSNTISAYNQYLSNNRKGTHRSKANSAIRKLKSEKADSDYAYAKRKNSSSNWKKFLRNYPNHWNKSQIEEDIIRLKVDEIMGDKKTGQLPSFSKTDYSYSSTSTVTIKNDTRYKLIVRYSGPSIREIVIPRGASKTTTLSSGSYKIAASAGGLNYAGREKLSGSYNSKYYITTSRY